MNENINLTKILKNCPEEFELYTPLYGKVFFLKVNEKNSSSIVVRAASIGTILFTKEGHYFETATDGECLLLPSKEMRDWSKFTAPWLKKERFDPKMLNPFDKVLIRYRHDSIWYADLFSHYVDNNNIICVNSTSNKCIPYNDDTKHLVGTTDEAPEFYKYWED